MSREAVAAKRPEPKEERALPTRRARASRRIFTAYRLHSFGGLAAALWLAVLGVTGFLLDHRDWRWMWSGTVPDFLAPADMVEKSRGGAVRLYRIHPENSAVRLAGGAQGLWRSGDAGVTWRRTAFAGTGEAPWVYSIVEDPSNGWGRLWLATDDGIWVSADSGATAQRFTLEGDDVTSLAAGGERDLLGVVSKSRVFRLQTGATPKRAEWVSLGPVEQGELPESFDLSRFTHDLHYGRGLVNGLASILINDLGGGAMLILPLTGVVFWAMPRRWKNRRAAGRPGHARQRRVMRWLYGSHATIMGLAGAIPIFYLSVTGIMIDHRDFLQDWMRSVRIGRGWLPPVYDLRSWDGEIYNITGYPGEPEKMSAGTRGGLYTSTDGGLTWRRERLPGPSGFVWTLRRAGEYLLIGGMGSPSYLKKGDEPWQVLKGAGHMPSDAAVTPDGRIAIKSHKGVMTGGGPGGFTQEEISFPHNHGVPWFYIIDGLHSGAIIHPQWKWVNDIVSILALMLVATGTLRWYRRKRVHR